MRIVTATALAVLLAPIGARQDLAGLAPAPCDSLRSLALPNTTVTLAQVVEAGAFTPPASAAPPGAPAPAVYKSLAAFCRVAATLKPSADSDIKIEVWLPVAGWNGKFEGVGNRGWAGAI